MDRVLSSFGIPSEIGSDNGSPFNSEEYGKYAKYMGFKNTKKIPYAPWANGMVENFMKNLNKVIETANEEKRNWRQEMHKFLRAYRATPHTMTQKPPATLLFNGRKYKTRLPTPTTRTVLLYDKEVRQADNKSKALMKHRADSKGHVRTSKVQVGDRVVCKQLRRRKSTTPYSNEILVVVERKGSLVTAVGDNRTLTRHVNHFKRLASDFDIEKGGGRRELQQTDILTPPPSPQGQNRRVELPLGREQNQNGRPAEQSQNLPPQCTEASQGSRPTRDRRPPRRILDEDFLYYTHNKDKTDTD